MEKIKRCTHCARFLGESAFSWRNKAKGYRQSECRKCHSTVNYIWAKQNHKHKLQNQRQWRRNNPNYDKQYCQNNHNKVNAKAAKRRAMKLNQSPQLTEEEKHRMEVLYGWAQELPGVHVDHIEPLSGGGLHHPDNLQIIPTKQNLEKGAKYPKEFYGRFYEFCAGKTPTVFEEGIV